MNILKFRFVGCCLAAACLTPTIVFADQAVINDPATGTGAYWGGMVTWDGNTDPIPSNSDVVGPIGHYDVAQMTVDRTATSLTVTLTGNYFKWAEADRFVGDLFLSTKGWTPYSGPDPDNYGGPPTYSMDNLTAPGSTVWNYVLHIDGVSSSDPVGTAVSPDGSVQKGKISLYAVDSSGTIIKPEDLLYMAPNGQMITQGNEYYRENQAVAYDPNDPNGQKALEVGDWLLDPNGTLTFSLNGVNLGDYGLDSDLLAFHWTMSCGNDIIEGSMSGGPAVPEPATMMLFGLGLSGLAAYRIRRKK